MTDKKELLELINDLIRINKDRIEGYLKANSELKEEDVDLRALFQSMINESEQYVSELTNHVINMGGSPAEDSTTSGKIYRTWMDLKAIFTGKDRKSLLSSCEYGEDAAQKAYDDAITSEVEIDAESRQLIVDQKASLKRSHDVIKKYRDLQAAVA